MTGSKLLPVLACLGTFGFGLCQTAVAETQHLKTYVKPLPQTPADVAEQFSAITDELTVTKNGDAIVLSYAGLEAPEELAKYLATEFPALQLETLEHGHAANLSIALVPDGDGTEMRVMMFQPGSEVSAQLVSDLPEGSKILINDGHGNDCLGQMVIDYNQTDQTAATVFPEWMTASGYDVTDMSDASTSFFVGNQSGCSVFMYIHPNSEAQKRSTVVLRYLED